MLAQQATDDSHRKLKAVHEGPEEEGAMSPEISALLESYAEEDFPKQFESLYHPNPQVRIKAIDKLVSDADDHPELVERIAKLTYDPNVKVREAVFEDLFYQIEHYPSDKILQPLIDGLFDSSIDVVTNATRLLEGFGPESHQAVPRLIKLLEDEEAGSWAASTLGAIGEKAKPAIPKLAEQVGGDRNFAYALGKLGAEKELLESLEKLDTFQQGIVAEGLALISPTTDDTVAAFGRHLNSGGVVHALGDLKPANEKIVEYLSQALKSDNESIRRYAADALGKLEPKLPSALPLLNAALKDEEADVRATAAKSLKGYELGPEQKLKMQLSVAGEKGLLEGYTLGEIASDNADYDVVKKLVSDPKAPALIRLNGLSLLERMQKEDEQVLDFNTLATTFLNSDESSVELKAISGLILSQAASYKSEYDHVTSQMTDAIRAGLREAEYELLRERCCEALGWLKAESAIGDLLDSALKEEFHEAAYRALTAIGSDEAVPHLVRHVRKHIETNSRSKYVGAVDAVGKMGTGAQELLPVLQPLLEGGPEDWYYFRESTAQAISRILVANKLDTAPYVTQFSKMLGSDESEISEAGLEGLKLMPDEALPPAADTIGNRLRTQIDHHSANSLVELLGRSGPASSKHADAVLNYLAEIESKDSRKYNAGDAFTALTKMRVPKIYLPVIEKEFKREDGLPGEALSALFDAGPDAALAIPFLNDELKDNPDDSIRRRICDLYSLLGKAGDPAIPALIVSLKDDPEFTVKYSAKDTLIRIGYENSDALAALFSLYKDGKMIGLFDRRSEDNQFDPVIVRSILNAALASDDPEIISGAVEELASADDISADEEIFLDALESEHTSVRSASMKALSRIGGHEQRLKLAYIGLLHSDDEDIREDAFYRLQYADPATRRELVTAIVDIKRPIELRRRIGELLLENEELPFSAVSQLKTILQEDDLELKQWVSLLLKRENALDDFKLLEPIVDSENLELRTALASHLRTNDNDAVELHTLSQQLLIKLFSGDEEGPARQAAYSIKLDEANEKFIQQCKSWLNDEQKSQLVFRLLQGNSSLTPELLTPEILLIAKDPENEQANSALNAIWKSTKGAELLMGIAVDDSLDVEIRKRALSHVANGRPYLDDESESKEPWLQLDELKQLAALLDAEDKTIAQYAAIAATYNDKFNSKVGKLLVEAIEAEKDWQMNSLLSDSWQKIGERGKRIIPLLIEAAATEYGEHLGQIAVAVAAIDPNNADGIAAVFEARRRWPTFCGVSIKPLGKTGHGALGEVDD